MSELRATTSAYIATHTMESKRKMTALSPASPRLLAKENRTGENDHLENFLD
jgi:hypothetical protein